LDPGAPGPLEEGSSGLRRTGYHPVLDGPRGEPALVQPEETVVTDDEIARLLDGDP